MFHLKHRLCTLRSSTYSSYLMVVFSRDLFIIYSVHLETDITIMIDADKGRTFWGGYRFQGSRVQVMCKVCVDVAGYSDEKLSIYVIYIRDASGFGIWCENKSKTCFLFLRQRQMMMINIPHAENAII